MILHAGMTICEEEEIAAFYEEMLGFTVERTFTLESGLNQRIFRRQEEVRVSLLVRGGERIELFLGGDRRRDDYAHLCVEVEDRDGLIDKAREKGYPCTVIERPGQPLVFVEDRSGNRFEIRQAS
jgi:catechol 2,3-dioxygenase-like lactoylglutathione lyase family enzyme